MGGGEGFKWRCRRGGSSVSLWTSALTRKSTSKLFTALKGRTLQADGCWLASLSRCGRAALPLVLEMKDVRRSTTKAFLKVERLHPLDRHSRRGLRLRRVSASQRNRSDDVDQRLWRAAPRRWFLWSSSVSSRQTALRPPPTHRLNREPLPNPFAF